METMAHLWTISPGTWQFSIAMFNWRVTDNNQYCLTASKSSHPIIAANGCIPKFWLVILLFLIGWYPKTYYFFVIHPSFVNLTIFESAKFDVPSSILCQFLPVTELQKAIAKDLGQWSNGPRWLGLSGTSGEGSVVREAFLGKGDPIRKSSARDPQRKAWHFVDTPGP